LIQSPGANAAACSRLVSGRRLGSGAFGFIVAIDLKAASLQPVRGSTSSERSLKGAISLQERRRANCADAFSTRELVGWVAT
jgi:hypothetical protein